MAKKAVLIVAGVLVAAGAVAAVSAQGMRNWRAERGMMGDGADAGMGPGGFWRRGALTKDEHESRTRERFARLDKNSDGVIDIAEVEATLKERSERRGPMRERMTERMLSRFDENRDGKVTREEFSNSIRQRFAEFDLNNDGRITDDDLPPMMRGRGVLSGDAGGGPGFGRGRGGGMMGWLRGADANKDGAITLEEAQAHALAMFTRFDKNNDGAIDTADAEAMQKEMLDYRVKRFVHQFGADRDGKVTREQFFKRAAERFARADLNNDGRLSRDELPGGWRGRGHHHRHHGSDGDDDRGGRRDRGMMGPDGPGRGGPPRGEPKQ